MLVTFKQCRHCGSRYVHQMYGAGCDSELNNSEYCPSCYEVMMLALKKVPVKFHSEYKEVEADKTILEALETLKKKMMIMLPMRRFIEVLLSGLPIMVKNLSIRVNITSMRMENCIS